MGATKCKVLYCGSYLLGCYPPLYGERVQKKGSRVKKKKVPGSKKRVAGSKKRVVGSKKRVLGSKKNKEGRVKKKGEWGQKKKGRVKKKGDQISGTLFFDPGSKETDLGSKKKVGSKKKKVGSKKRPAPLQPARAYGDNDPKPSHCNYCCSYLQGLVVRRSATCWRSKKRRWLDIEISFLKRSQQKVLSPNRSPKSL